MRSTYILFIISYVELILSESFGKFQCLLILYADGNYLTFSIIEIICILPNLDLWHASTVVYL